jgi:flagellar FliL protein
MSADTALAAAAPPEKKSKKKLLIMVVLALAVAGAAYWFLLAPKSAAPAAEPPPEPGAVVDLDPIYINLQQGHFLKLGLAVQGTKKAGKEMSGSRVLDIAIDTFSGQDMDKLSELEVRAELKKEMVDKVVEVYEGEVMDVYFTEFVMQ